MDKEKEEEWLPEKPRLEVLWRQLVENRPCLSDSSTVEDLEDEVGFIQRSLVSFLETHVRRVTVCAQSKRWWNEEIRGKRQQLGRVLW